MTKTLKNLFISDMVQKHLNYETFGWLKSRKSRVDTDNLFAK